MYFKTVARKNTGLQKKKDTLFNIAQHNKMLTTALVLTIGSMADIHYWAFQQHLKGQGFKEEARILRKRQGFKEEARI